MANWYAQMDDSVVINSTEKFNLGKFQGFLQTLTKSNWKNDGAAHVNCFCRTFIFHMPSILLFIPLIILSDFKYVRFRLGYLLVLKYIV